MPASIVPFKETLESFAEIERAIDVNAIRYHDIRIWPLIRWDIYGVTCGPSRVVSTTPDISRRQILSPTVDLLQAVADNRRGCLFFSREMAHTEVLDGKEYCPFLDPMVALAQEAGYATLKIEASPQAGLSQARKEPTFHFVPIGHPATQRAYSGIEHFKACKELVAKLFHLDLPEDGFQELVHQIEDWSQFFSAVLRVGRPKAVFEVCYYDLATFGLCLACKRTGIPLIDLQHGTFGGYHGLYTHWTRMPPEGYELLPDVFWTWGSRSQQAILQWFPAGTHKPHVRVGANLRVASWLTRAQASDGIPHELRRRLREASRSILLTLGFNVIPPFVLDAMKQAPTDWLWLIRLHPVYDSPLERQKLHEQLRVLGIPNYEIDHATETLLYCLLPQVNHLLCAFSSSCYDALAFNVPVTLYDEAGLKFYRQDVDDGLMAYAADVNGILQSVSTPAQVHTPDSVMVRRLEEAQTSLKHILGTTVPALPPCPDDVWIERYWQTINVLDSDFLRQAYPPSLAMVAVEAYVKARWQLLAAPLPDGRRKRIAIYGGGKHTLWLYQLVKELPSPDVVAIMDDRPETVHETLWNCPVVHPKELHPQTVDAILLSSDSQTARMKARCLELLGSEREIIDVYEGFPPGPYPKLKH